MYTYIDSRKSQVNTTRIVTSILSTTVTSNVHTHIIAVHLGFLPNSYGSRTSVDQVTEIRLR